MQIKIKSAEELVGNPHEYALKKYAGQTFEVDIKYSGYDRFFVHADQAFYVDASAVAEVIDDCRDRMFKCDHCGYVEVDATGGTPCPKCEARKAKSWEDRRKTGLIREYEYMVGTMQHLDKRVVYPPVMTEEDLKNETRKTKADHIAWNLYHIESTRLQNEAQIALLKSLPDNLNIHFVHGSGIKPHYDMMLQLEPMNYQDIKTVFATLTPISVFHLKEKGWASCFYPECTLTEKHAEKYTLKYEEVLPVFLYLNMPSTSPMKVEFCFFVEIEGQGVCKVMIEVLDKYTYFRQDTTSTGHFGQETKFLNSFRTNLKDAKVSTHSGGAYLFWENKENVEEAFLTSGELR